MNKTIRNRNRQTTTSWPRCLVFALALTLVFASCGQKRKDASSWYGKFTTTQARFTIAGNYLYAVNNHGDRVQIFDITTASNPVPVNIQNAGFEIEKIFSYNQYLFMGSRNGMSIYDNSNPQLPLKVGSLPQAGGCDPVVVEGNYAYVAIGSGTTQWTPASTTSNELDVIDISTISAPVLVKSYPMQGLSAIGVDSGRVFICDGLDGLKVFDVTDPANLTLIQQIAGQNCYDLVPGNNHLVVSGSDGLYQYDYTVFPMMELSKL